MGVLREREWEQERRPLHWKTSEPLEVLEVPGVGAPGTLLVLEGLVVVEEPMVLWLVELVELWEVGPWI